MQYVPNGTPGLAADFFGAGKHGFANGDPTIGQRGTRLVAALMNDLLGNLMKTLEEAGIAPTPARYLDLPDAIRALAVKRTIMVKNTDAYQITAADNGKMIIYDTSGGALSTIMPDVTAVPLGFYVELRCEGANALTVNRTGAQTFEGATSVVVGARQSVDVVGDQVLWRTRRVPSALYLPGRALITATGNFIVPAGVSLLKSSKLWSAGGSGAGTVSGTHGSGGSGGGFCAKFGIAVIPGQSIAVTLGAPGAAPANGANNGNSAASSSFGAIMSATGGGRGKHGAAADPPGTGSGGDINLSGGKGTDHTGFTPGMGGGSPLGGGAGGGWHEPGVFPGGGGGPGNTAAPGAGAAAYCEVEY